MGRTIITRLFAAAAAFMFIGAAQVRADMYGFYNLSANDVANAAAGESQLAVEVTDAGGGKALFHFTNTGAAAMSITDVYFDNGTVLGSLDAIINSAGVSFSDGASPPDLPSGTNATPDFNADFAMDSDSPVQPNGVNPGETLDVRFVLAGGKSFSDLLAELNNAATRIGIHVQGYANGGSEAFINTPNNVVPAPGALALGAAGFGLIGAIRRRLK